MKWFISLLLVLAIVAGSTAPTEGNTVKYKDVKIENVKDASHLNVVQEQSLQVVFSALNQDMQFGFRYTKYNASGSVVDDCFYVGKQYYCCGLGGGGWCWPTPPPPPANP